VQAQQVRLQSAANGWNIARSPWVDDALSQFKLMFAPGLISELAARHRSEEDTVALKTGARIRAGECTHANLVEIFDWKTGGRGRSRLEKNTDEEIADALHLAMVAKTERAAIAVLTGLNGVQVPVASAILTAIDPERFTIIDFRALQALNAEHPITLDFYLDYLDECRRLAKANNVDLRTLDRALWQWSKKKPEI